MEGNISIKSPVDLSLLDKVEEECYQILFQQRLLYNERWYSSSLFLSGSSILRLTVILLSVLGVLLCLFYILYPSTCPTWFYIWFYLLFFISIGLAFYFIVPRIEVRFIARMKNTGSQSCKRTARRMIKKAKVIAPYNSEYIIRGDSISYFRDKDNKWNQVWSQRLKGYAVLGKHATLLFRKATSVHPTMLILYENKEAIESVLKLLEVSHTTID